jgi:hypothetical protein
MLEIRVVSPEDYEKVLKRAYNNIFLINIYCTLKFYVDGCLEGSLIKVYEITDGPDSLYGVTLEILGGEG